MRLARAWAPQMGRIRYWLVNLMLEHRSA